MNDRSRYLLGRPPASKAEKARSSRLGRIREELGVTKEDFDRDASIRAAVMREYSNRRNSEIRRSRNDIGELPEVKDPGRRSRCRLDLLAFIEAYCRSDEAFNLPWSRMHLDVIAEMQDKILHGGMIAMAMPRASGKSAVTTRAIIWCLLYGHRRFVVAIGDGKAAAMECLETVKTELEFNDRLCEDFPEVCLPVRRLNGLALRAATQTCNGVLTQMEWGSSGRVVFPTIEGSQCSGSVLVCCGINSRLRGMKFATPDGRELRPDMVFLDDFINDRSARSPAQNEKRLGVVHGSVLGLAGPGKKITAIMAGTVIQKGDAVDTLLDRERSPAWNGVRYSLLAKMPKNTELWQTYREIWERSQREGKGIAPATEFYVAHRKALDAGAAATWEARYNPDEASAIQHGMDLLFRDAESFYAEYQNQPLGASDDEGFRNLREADIYIKMNGLKRGVCPLETERVCVGTDVQLGLLVWVACAGCADGSVHVLDYGTWPKQRTPNYWTLQSLSSSWHNGGQVEAELYAALTAFKQAVSRMQWTREDGSPMAASRVLVDGAWGKSTQTVLRWCRENGDGIYMPSFGRGIGPQSKPYGEYRRQPGMTIGAFWLRTRHQKTMQQVLEIDTNSAKSLAKGKILSPQGTPGALSLFGRAEQAAAHKGFAQQLCGEYSVLTSGRFREVEVWTLRPGAENHYLDCLGYALAALSEQGIDLSGVSGGRAERKARRKAVRLPKPRPAGE